MLGHPTLPATWYGTCQRYICDRLCATAGLNVEDEDGFRGDLPNAVIQTNGAQKKMDWLSWNWRGGELEANAVLRPVYS